MKAKMCLKSFRKIKHIDVYHGITGTLQITCIFQQKFCCYPQEIGFMVKLIP